MIDKVSGILDKITKLNALQATVKVAARMAQGNSVFQAKTIGVLREGPAMRVIFFYPGEEGTYVDDVHVTLLENGVAHIRSKSEETSTHLQNCEVLWKYEVEERPGQADKIRLLRPKKGPETSPPMDRNDEPEPHPEV